MKAPLLTGLALLLALALPGRAEAEAERIASIGGSVTEIVYALGQQERIVAVDATSLYPPAARSHPDVGYLRALSAEPILATAPDLILTEADAGPPQVLEQLRQSGIAVIAVPDESSLAGVAGKVRAVAAALGSVAAGESLIAEIERQAGELAAQIATAPTRPRVLFLLSAGRGAPLAAGRGTSAEAIIELAGGENAISGFEGYKPLSPESAIAAAPEVVLTTTRTLEGLGGAQALLSLPALAATPAARDGRLLALDGLLLLGFGPRTPEAMRALATALHPELHLEQAAKNQPASGD
ncbi:MAG: ABC transporter substrate-binding protein [Rhodovibrionaceae bacterium]